MHSLLRWNSAGRGEESHFAVDMASEAFTGKGRVERRRTVDAVLDKELKGGAHALRLALRDREHGAGLRWLYLTVLIIRNGL